MSGFIKQSKFFVISFAVLVIMLLLVDMFEKLIKVRLLEMSYLRNGTLMINGTLIIIVVGLLNESINLVVWHQCLDNSFFVLFFEYIPWINDCYSSCVSIVGCFDCLLKLFQCRKGENL